MAAADKGQPVLADKDFISENKRWTIRCDQEQQAAKNWESKWGDLLPAYQDVYKHSKIDFTKGQLASVKPVTPISKYIKVEPSPTKPPKTTSGQVGWRSVNPACNLEKFGREAKGKGDIVKQFNWPLEGCI